MLRTDDIRLIGITYCESVGHIKTTILQDNNLFQTCQRLETGLLPTSYRGSFHYAPRWRKDSGPGWSRVFHYAPRWRKDPGPDWSRVSQILGDNNWDLWGVGKANVAFDFKAIQGVRIKQHKGVP